MSGAAGRATTGTSGAGGIDPDLTARDTAEVARWADRLCRAGVPWPTTRRLAVTVELAGLPAVEALGDDVVEGQGVPAVRALLAALAAGPDPVETLRRVAWVQRLLATPPPAAAAMERSR